MPIETGITRARNRVQAEQDAVDEKLAAFDSFIDCVDEMSTETASSPSLGMTATTGAQLQRGTSTTDRCQVVRTAFAETIRPHSIDDLDESESLLETIHHELSESIAVALAPTTETSFTPEIQQAVLAEAGARRTEATALRQALDREEAALTDAAKIVDTITAWIADVNESSLTDLGFGALQHRHETLATHREHCEELAMGRQAFLRETTNQGIDAGIHHRSLIPYLYQDFQVDHPILATAIRLDETCAKCQRTVREHLVRRG